MERSSISRSVEILKLLADGINRFSDIMENLVLSKSTTHRLLKKLESSELVVQDPITKKYYLSSLILMLASRPGVSHQQVILCALNEIKQLQGLVDETIMILVRVGTHKVIIEEFPSRHEIKYSQGKGFCGPIYTGASGKLLLSELNDHDLHLLLDNIPLEPVGPNTITCRKQLITELEKIRKQGFALSYGERIAGSASVSVPIKTPFSPYALTVMGPDSRFNPLEITGDLKYYAQKISAKFKSTHLETKNSSHA